MKQSKYQKQVKQEKKDRYRERLAENHPVNNGRMGMEAIKKHLWSRGIKARDVSRLYIGYDLLVDDFWKVECKSSLWSTNGYVIRDVKYLKFDILSIALFEPLMEKYRVYYLKNKNDLAYLTSKSGPVVERIVITKEKLDLYFTTRPKEVFTEFNKLIKTEK